MAKDTKSEKILVRMNEQTLEKLKSLQGYFGRTNSEVVRRLIDDYYDAAVVRGKKQPAVGTGGLAPEFIQEITGLIELIVPALKDRLTAAEGEIRDAWMRIKKLEEAGGKK